MIPPCGAGCLNKNALSPNETQFGDVVLDYLLIGHVSIDLTPDGPKAGGAVTFASRVAQLMGYRTAVLTSAAPDFDLDAALPAGVEVRCLPSEQTTTFENIYDDNGNRRQKIHAVGRQITADDVPGAWRNANIVHLAPIADEIHHKVARAFPQSLLTMTPQGWLRGWDHDGWVFPQRATHGAELAILAKAIVVSDEDLVSRERQIRQTLPLVPYLALTRGSQGCVVHAMGERRTFTPPAVQAIDATGAGDTFATTFFIELHRTGDPWAAARFANIVAAHSVTQPDASSKERELARVVAEWREHNERSDV